MCVVLNIPISPYYYHADLSNKHRQKAKDIALSKEITRIFKGSRNNYGARKIKREWTELPKPNKFHVIELSGESGTMSACVSTFSTFANQAHFISLEQLALELWDYIHWFNNLQIQGTLGYLTPIEFKQQPKIRVFYSR